MNSSLHQLPGDTDDRASQNRGIYIFVVLPVLATVTSLFVAARFYNRIGIHHEFRFDDYLIAFSLLCIWLNTSFQINAAVHGIGRHMDTLTPDHQTMAQFWYYTSSFLAVSGLGIPKMAVVSLICRVFDPLPWHRCVMWAASIICTIQFFFATATFLMQCKPYYALWDVTITDEVCRSPYVFLYFRYYATSFGAFMDFYLAIYPAIRFQSMGFTLKKKLALSLTLGLGVLATATAIYKATYLRRLASKDFTWQVLDLIVWTAVEGCLIVIAACVPMLQPVYAAARERFAINKREQGSSADANGSGINGQDGPAVAQDGFWSLKLRQALEGRFGSVSASAHTGTTQTGTTQTRTDPGNQASISVNSRLVVVSESRSTRVENGGAIPAGEASVGPHDIILLDQKTC